MSCQRLTILILLCFSTTGCHLFRTNGSDGVSLPRPFARNAAKADTESGAATRKVVRLDAAVVVQPATDQRIRELVWAELDESGLMDPADRQRLNQNGFRVGVSGRTLPWAVTSLVANGSAGQRPSTDAISGRADHLRNAARFGSPVVIPEGSDSQILLCSGIHLGSVPDEILPDQQVGDSQNGRCLLHVEVVEYGEGWVVLKFLPEIHSGTSTTRYSVENGRESLATRQRVTPLYEQQFEVKLHTDEAVVVGHLESPDWTPGRLFFRSESLTAAQECLLVLRLSDIEEVVGQKGVNVQYSKY